MITYTCKHPHLTSVNGFTDTVQAVDQKLWNAKRGRGVIFVADLGKF